MKATWQHRRPAMVVLALALAIAVVGATAVASTAVQAQVPVPRTPVYYGAPIQTQVIDPFRPPAHIGASGNRGLEYGSSDNQVITASAAGSVIFAGSVAGRNAITIRHADGIRTTYTGLVEIWVEHGMYVHKSWGIALADTGFHFGARVRDHYLDPQVLLDASVFQERPRLIAEPPR